MINPLKIATSGYLKRTKNAALVIAVSGYLSFGENHSVQVTQAHGGHINYGQNVSLFNNHDGEEFLIDVINFWVKEMQH